MTFKFISLVLRDRHILVLSLLLGAVIGLLFFLRETGEKQQRVLVELREQKGLAARLPELEAEYEMLITPVPKSKNLTLSGIIFNQDSPLAIINDNLVKAGDIIEADIRVVSITGNAVELNDGAESIVLKLEE